MHEPAHAIAILALDHHESRVAAGDAQLQRGLNILGDVDGDDRRDRGHHLAGLLLVQVEDAGEHPRLAGIELAAGIGLGDQPLELVGRATFPLCAHLDAEQAQDATRDDGQADDHRMEQDAERLQRAGDPAGDRLGAVDRVQLGHHLSRDQLRGGDQPRRRPPPI